MGGETYRLRARRAIACGPREVAPGVFVRVDCLRDALPAGALPCPPAFSAALCARRADIVAKLADVSVLGAHPIDPVTASGIADAVLHAVEDTATAGAKRVVVIGLAASAALTLVGVGFAVKAARHARGRAAS